MNALLEFVVLLYSVFCSSRTRQLSSTAPRGVVFSSQRLRNKNKTGTIRMMDEERTGTVVDGRIAHRRGRCIGSDRRHKGRGILNKQQKINRKPDLSKIARSLEEIDRTKQRQSRENIKGKTTRMREPDTMTRLKWNRRRRGRKQDTNCQRIND